MTSPDPRTAGRKAAGQKPATEEKGSQQNERELETALEDTFPASDPPSQSSPTQAVGWDAPEEEAKDKKKGG
ncbi:hypothetical protein CR162_02260 [Pseudoroseomonas rhizosphaerae]|uniref:Uncharacterized protein n=1 Tax=Teichococcus rhizosphaerae TaxID=1335062 RepID=A0A2C7AHX1_9PROT|nr:hypothetical protein [Pseudoroseomonas rhizosphaerae]PHK96744.1 hypothetical protein CR162_02260 [Pseudoroseomonas rhizosphaerae]